MVALTHLGCGGAREVGEPDQIEMPMVVCTYYYSFATLLCCCFVVSTVSRVMGGGRLELNWKSSYKERRRLL